MNESMFGLLGTWLGDRRMRRSRRRIERSGLFDEIFYRSRTSLAPEADAIEHYLREGWQTLNPNRLFDTAWYMETYATVRTLSKSPLIDFIEHSPARNPGPYFDAAQYLVEHPDVAASGANPLAHYLHFGQGEGRSVRLVPGAVPKSGAPLTRYESWLSANALSKVDIKELDERLAAAESLPTISIITPVYRPDEHFLARAIESVRGQLSQRWELLLIADGDREVAGPLIDYWADQDDRIRALHLDVNMGISAATNAGGEAARGDVLLFLDQDDELSPDCLAEVALHYLEFPTSDLVYSDDDKIDESGRRYDPQFKPDWSPALLLSWMYVGHVLTVRRSLFESLGGFRSEFDGAQDFDFTLRAVEIARRIGHVPKILYHWRAIEGSTALAAKEKPLSIERGRVAVERALERRGAAGVSVAQADWAQRSGAGAYELRFGQRGDSVAVILEPGFNLENIRSCVKSLRSSESPPDEVAIAAGSNSEDGSEIRALAKELNCPVVSGGADGILQSTTAELLLFLNADLVPTRPDWLNQLSGWMKLGGNGVVGARIRCDGRLVEAGRIRGSENLAVPAFEGVLADEPGYLGFAKATRESWAVGPHCLLTSRSVFAELGGFLETMHSEAAAADFCRRAASAGYEILICGSVDFEATSAKDLRPQQSFSGIDTFRSRHGHLRDVYYSPHLSSEDGQFKIASLRPEIRACQAVRLAAVSHNLNREGASNVLLDLLVGLKAAGAVEPFVFSPIDGPLRLRYEAAGIEVLIKPGLGDPPPDLSSLQAKLDQFSCLLRDRGASVCLANTLNSYWAVRSATSAGIPCLWAQHESDPWETYFDFLPADARSVAFEVFAEAYQVLYVSSATRDAWRPLETRHNFQVIRHGVPKDLLARETARWTKSSARLALGLPGEAFVLCLMGTVCRRKGQLDAINAFLTLPLDLRERTYLHIVGPVGEEFYATECEAAASAAGDRVKFLGATDDPFLHYKAADLALCTSRIESAPRVLIEAMACDLPIVTTPVFGIPEIVAEDVNALFYPPGDTVQLAILVELLLRDGQRRSKMGASSSRVLNAQPGYAEMVQAYRACIRQASALSMPDYLNPHATFSVA